MALEQTVNKLLNQLDDALKACIDIDSLTSAYLKIQQNLSASYLSLSFVSVTSSLGFFMISFLHYVIDVKRLWSGAPFIYPGMNAILLYVGHEIAYNLFPFHWSYGKMNTHLIVTLENMWGSFLWTVIAYMLYKRKIFISL